MLFNLPWNRGDSLQEKDNYGIPKRRSYQEVIHGETSNHKERKHYVTDVIVKMSIFFLKSCGSMKTK
uniref:Uncharacterized protein n=1 Tax=Pyxicephalus adspersus TaxID=30357 RepID=A0AAV3A4F1_PYXAD|nr:TPA: hypothetical protein GDO54_013434 [Pyxicephalus adspersus]